VSKISTSTSNLRQDHRESIRSALLIIIIMIAIIRPQRQSIFALLLDSSCKIFSHLQLPGRRSFFRLLICIHSLVGTFTLVSPSGRRQRLRELVDRLRRGTDLRAVA